MLIIKTLYIYILQIDKLKNEYPWYYIINKETVAFLTWLISMIHYHVTK